MKKVEVINNKTSQIYGAKFSDDLEMQDWIDKNKSDGSWGKPERAYIVKKESDIPKDESVDDLLSIEEIDSKDGKLFRYTFKADFTLTITDISLEADLDFKRGLVRKAMALGEDLIGDVAMINVKNNRTSQEILGLMSNPSVGVIIHLLQTGALSSAKTAIIAFDSPMFTQQDKDGIIAKIDAFFNSFVV